MNRTIPIVPVAASPPFAEAYPQPRSRVKAERHRTVFAGLVAPARLQVENVFFREDEWLGDMALSEAVSPVCTALGVIYESLLNKIAPI